MTMRRQARRVQAKLLICNAFITTMILWYQTFHIQFKLWRDTTQMSSLSLSMATSSFRRGSHRMKKRMSMAVASSKHIFDGLPECYVVNRRRLENLERTLKTVVDLSIGTKRDWTSILKTRREITELVRMGSEDDGAMEMEATSTLTGLDLAASDIEDLRREIVKQTQTNTGIQAYLTEIESVKKSFADVETAFHEVVRYRNKIDKLKAMKKSKNDKIEINGVKLEGAKAKYQAKLNCVMAMIQATMEKRDAFLQSAFYAFWMNEHCYEAPMCRHSKSIRETVFKRRGRLSLLSVADPNPKPISD